MSDVVSQSEARKWIDSLEGKWRLQVMSRRQRLNVRTGERKDLPVRIRRFVEGIPWAFVPEGIRYLVSKAPYRGLVFNGLELDDEYRPTLTAWQRDDRETVNTQSGRPDGTYTLVQDLISTREDDLYSASTSASCSEEVVTEWHWDAAEPVPLPPAEQGVTWQLAQVGRKDDGTFDYALVKRTAVTQHAGRTVSSDTATARESSDTWDNVYTDGSGRYVDNTGARLDIPKPGSKDGVVCEVVRQENADCTFKITAKWTESKSATVREGCEKTQFQHEHSQERIGQAEPLGEAPAAAGGVIERHQDQLQPDGSFSTSKSVRTELPVKDAVVQVTVGRRGSRIERLDRNQAVPAAIEGLAPGNGAVVKKTDGGLYDNTTIKFERVSQSVGETCEEDLYKHEHALTRSGLDSVPGPDDHVKDSGKNGVVKSRRTEMDDEGAITQTTQTRTEKEVKSSRESWEVRLRGVRHSVTDTQTDKVPAAPRYSRENIGTAMTVEKTPGGLYNVTVEEFEKSGKKIEAGSGCSRTVFEHGDTSVSVAPAGDVPEGHVEKAGGGTYRKRDARLNEDGSVVVTDETVVEVPVEGAEVEIRKTAKAVITTRTDRNVSRSAEEPAGIGTQRHTTNRGGSRDVTVVTVEPLGRPDRAHCETTVFEHRHDDVTVRAGDRADSSDAPSAGGGKYYVKDSSVDDYGVVTTTLREITELPERQWREKRVTLQGVFETTVFQNAPGDHANDVTEVGESSQARMTPGGKFSGSFTKRSPKDVGEIARRTETTVFESLTSSTENRNAPGADAPRAGGGRHYRHSSRQTDVGTWDVTEEDVDEIPQMWIEKRKTLQGVVVTTVYRNTPDDHSADVLNVGDSSQARMTPGGRFDASVTRLEKGDGFEIAFSDSNTVFEHRHSDTEIVPDVPDKTAESAGNGHTYSVSGRQNETGSWEYTEGYLDENVQDDRHGHVETRFEIRSSDRVRYDDKAPGDVAFSDATRGKIVRTDWSLSDGGRFNGETETRTAVEWDLDYDYIYRGRKYEVKKWRNQRLGYWKDLRGGDGETTSEVYGQLQVSENDFGLEDGEYVRVKNVGKIKSDILSTSLKKYPEFTTEYKRESENGEYVTKRAVYARIEYEKLFESMSDARDWAERKTTSHEPLVMQSHKIGLFTTILGHRLYVLRGYSPWVLTMDWTRVESGDLATSDVRGIEKALEKLV